MAVRGRNTQASVDSPGVGSHGRKCLDVLCSVVAPESYLISLGFEGIFTDTQVHRDSRLPCSTHVCKTAVTIKVMNMSATASRMSLYLFVILAPPQSLGTSELLSVTEFL